MSITQKALFGQEAVKEAMKRCGGKATPEQLRSQILVMIQAGIVASSLETTASRALRHMTKPDQQEIRKVTDRKTGRVLYYELVVMV